MGVSMDGSQHWKRSFREGMSSAGHSRNLAKETKKEWPETRDPREHEGYSRAEEVSQKRSCYCVPDCREVKSMKPET